ncbi:hypothetical protein [Intestinimonas butyriciproducens]|mgnify:CR=1 FL=1|uniref:hypothetical protein n=1 Tax=Intestinimonas butyriciproducens TaxID=1297617 RepID=UPI001899935E|nr:hypothetical protein [Intestinimonas butyriciproducens]MDB7829180.1 hypothetical protein [Intestinimonas butyriciproducens]
MPKYNINKIRSAGLRYIVSDKDGQMWAFELPPVRSGSHWRLADEHICPSHRGGNAEDDERYWREKIHRWYAIGRPFCMPIYDVPFDVSFYDEPYDIVEHGLVNPNDVKTWPKYDSMKG